MQGNRLKAAANRAYYAMFYAATSALLGVTTRPPRTHRGTISLFDRHYVQTGKLDIQFARVFQDANHLRLQSDYGASTEVEEQRVKETIDNAASFVAEVKRLVNED